MRGPRGSVGGYQAIKFTPTELRPNCPPGWEQGAARRRPCAQGVHADTKGIDASTKR